MTTENSTTKQADQTTNNRVVVRKVEIPVFRGSHIDKIPHDLYIPPDALEIFLDAFEGPLDLLLYLIKRNNMDVLDMCVADISKQYVAYVELIHSTHFGLATDYLVMAATLTEIKSRMLLPRQESTEEEEEDPRANLIRRLLEYERFKHAAYQLDALDRMDRDIFPVNASPPLIQKEIPRPEVKISELLVAFSHVLKRANLFTEHAIQREKLSTRERMAHVLSMLQSDRFIPFVSLFTAIEGRLGVVVTFLAIMELTKESLVELVQTEAFAAIHVKIKNDPTTSAFYESEDKRINLQISTSDYGGQKKINMNNHKKNK